MLLPIEDETRVSFTVHEHSTGAEFRFVMPGPHLLEAEWQAALHHLETLTPFPDPPSLQQPAARCADGFRRPPGPPVLHESGR